MLISAILRVACCVLACVAVYRCVLVLETHIRLMPRKRQRIQLEDILRDRTLCFLVFVATGVVIAYATSLVLFPICIVASAIFAQRAPAILDAHQAKMTRSVCDEHIDVMADIVAMGVRAGLSFDAALDMYCEKFDNRLSREMKTARLQWASGIASRKTALEDLATRIGSRALQRFTETALQAIHYGSPLASTLSSFSSDIRQRRRNAVERQIEKAPIKLLIPTGACILPAMLILVMGPVLIQFLGQGF